MSKYVNKNNEVYEAEMDLNVLRHTASHIMAQAIKRLFPNYRKEMKGIDWGLLFNTYKNQKYTAKV